MQDTTQKLYSKCQKASHLYTLRKQVHDFKQGTLDVTSYFSELSLLWQDMDLFQPQIDIVCGLILGQKPLPFLIEMCYEVRLEEDSTNAMSVPPATSLLPSVLDPRPMTVKKITRNQSLFASIARNGCAYMSEYASTFQPSGPTVNQNGLTPPSTLGAIAQSDMSQSLSLINVDGKNPWILNSGAIDHLIVQDPEPPQDQGMTNPIESCTNSKMSENDRSDTVVPEDMGENDSVDETEVKAGLVVIRLNRVIQIILMSDEYDPSLNIPIALRKGNRSCTKHPICNYVSYDSLPLQFKAFTASLDSIVIPKNIHIALECPE
ncbi:reverse transcriptase [Cucumis melo var. makuwa]|uniref:Reverse transcriptase n=1 Tax=Cucumis melo var. makuwa TaxID=1194695 RepID=A0A5D3BUW8_CUCMM|nr:reverse transcriptase [Cucumis melo var. makuwa]